MVAETSHELFSFLAKQIEAFLKEHHNDHFKAHKGRRANKEEVADEDLFDLGFTFSFPVNQVGINRGKLLRWTKGFDVKEAVGQDVCQLLQKEIDDLDLPVKVAALVNDTVGALMSRSYTSPGKSGTLLGAIFGTGTNGAYVEKLSNVKKMESMEGTYDKSTGLMIVNTEWGSFDNELAVLLPTKYDTTLDKESVNPGIQMFEKQISGMFLGEILRRALLDLHANPDPNSALFKDANSSTNDTGATTNISPSSPLFTPWGIDTSLLSLVEEDQSDHLRITKQILERDYGVHAPSTEDCEVVKLVAHAIGQRAARLAAVAIGAIIVETNKLNEDEIVDIGVDGSLVEFYPGFENMMRQAFREIKEIGIEGEKRIRIGLAKDGSGLGAALIALVAGETMKVSSP
ncbi:putative glucokinase [Phaeomoniella chlamydospora]|uniref:Phosphotransferase n=1 Tax=Phaeomoniella chlamydospora TaxID=158046 RepID=A0A0G2H2H9_PHACM|nr:putative glucokinase [Phaeomoniella chlamydospora]